MTATPSTELIDAEQFLHMPENEGAELVDGRIVEVPMGSLSSWIGGELLFLVRLYLSTHDLGWVFPQESGMAVWPNRPRHVRKPDLAFVRRGRLPQGRPGDGWLSVAPDLVVEVVSPGDMVEELEEKLDEYREAGIPLIWVIYPSLEKAHVLRAGRERTELTAGASLDGEDVLPGFRCSLAELFAAAREEK
jgi:Uma2 family endonuclease